MSFGFLGIQFGFALQLGNTSRIFQTLDADVEKLAIYTIAAPVTGLIVQPIIGYLSDRTWHPRWGRRRPYFLIGALLATVSLVLMPNSPTLYMAIGMLWVMDTAFNVSMEPFRAFVGDKLPASQRTAGYAMQSFFIGIGAVVAYMLPYIFSNWLNISNTAPEGEIPPSVKYSFYIGAIAFLAAVSWTVFKTKEYPPVNMEDFKKERASTAGVLNFLKETGTSIFKMPRTMIQLAAVQFFAWFALFAMWIYTTPTVAQNVFHSTDPLTKEFQDGGDWVGLCFAVYSGVAALAAFMLPWLASMTSRRKTHMMCLLAGALGLFALHFITNQYALWIAMVGIGIAWSSILSMPYAILIGSLPEKKLGFYVGVFNFFIVIPQIIAAGILGFLLKKFFNTDPSFAMIIGAVSFVISALLCLFIKEKSERLMETEPANSNSTSVKKF
ncbi:MAG: MFS transporter [Flavobacteriales bacterium]|nr:MFS transporter [Flavobacteriales bacterium]